MPKILVLGHGHIFGYQDTRCSPIPPNCWYENDFVCVDINPNHKPDYTHDLRTFPWKFASDNSFNMIIDTTGTILKHLYKKQIFCNELERILTPDGIFYGIHDFNYVNSQMLIT